MLDLRQLAEQRTIYPEFTTLSFPEVLNGIGKTTLLKVATYLIGNDLFSGVGPDNKTIITNWFSDGNRGFAQNLSDRLEAYKSQKGIDLTIVHVISCLKILQYGLELEEKGLLDIKSKEQSEIDLLFAMLLCNQNEDDNHTRDSEKIEKQFPNENPAALLLHMQFPTYDIINFSFSDYTYCQIVKSLMLFRFLETRPECAPLLAAFYAYFTIANWKEYFEKAIPPIMIWAKRDKASSVDILLRDDHTYKNNYAFLKRFALDNYVKMEDVDYIKIREKPLIEMDPYTFRIVHPLFLSDKIYKSLYFLLNQLYQITNKSLGNFRSWYTTFFSEGVCFRQLLQRAFPRPDVLLFDEDLKAQHIVGPPDSYLRINNNSFLFENKDILINAAIKESYDFNLLLAELKKKLLVEDGRPVGIGQIMSNIKKLLNGQNTYDKGFNPASTNIYPVLVTHDNMFNAPGLNQLMGVFFNIELQKLKDEGLNIAKIKPLTIINIDSFIQAQHLLSQNKITLHELIDKYQADSVSGASDFFSFSDYIINYLSNKFGNWRSQDLMHELLSASGK